VLLSVNFDILKCCFLTIRILSNLSQSPGNGISETLNLKISSGLWPSLSAPQSKRASYSTVTLTPLLLTDFTRQQGSSAACPDCARQLLSNLLRLEQLFSAQATSSNFKQLFLFERLFTTLLVAKNGMTLASSALCSLMHGLTKKSDNVSS
jgi:hypothetical protein